MSDSWIPLIILVLVLAIPLIWGMATFNSLVCLRLYVRESWSNVDTELKRRYELIPNLVRTVKGYAAHEREVLEAVTLARQRAADATGSVKSQAAHENAMVGRLRQLFAVVEGYPELKSDEHFLELQHELSNTEDRIQAARRFYNANVRDLNTRIESVPSNLIAGMFHFERAEFFEIENAGIRAAPVVRMA